jgi:hypothetical protein
MHKRFLILVALLMTAVMLFAACGDDEGGGDTETGGGDDTEEPSPPDDGAAGDTTFTAVDFGFQGPETLPAGKVKLTLENEGKEPHMLALIQLLQGKTIDDVTAFIKKQGVAGKPPSWAKQAGGIGVAKPGESKAGGANLKPGSYVAMCFVTSKKNDNKSHAELGMIYPITVE